MFMYPCIASKLRMERRSKEPSLLHIDRPLCYPCQYFHRRPSQNDHRRPNEQRMQWCVQSLDLQIFLARLFLTSERIPLNSHIQKSQVRLYLASFNIPGQNNHSRTCAIDCQSACVEAVDDSSIHSVLDHELPHGRAFASRDNEPIQRLEVVGKTNKPNLHTQGTQHPVVFTEVALKSADADDHV